MSLAELARLTGLSQATVSRVLNSKPGVSPEKVQQVRKAMQQLGYTPPARRRGPKPKLRSGLNTGNVAMLMVGTDPTLIYAPATAAVLHAVEESLASHGLNLTFSQIPRDGRIPPNVEGGKVDGLLLHGFPPVAKVAERMRHLPSVWMLSQRTSRGYWGDRVQPDNQAVGHMAARYLLEAGHRHMAVLNANPSHLGFKTRAVAFSEEVVQAGGTSYVMDETTHDDELPLDTTSAQDHIARLIEHALQRDPRPTALFIPHYRITALAYPILRARGIEPGRDIAIVSCDSQLLLEALDPMPPSIDVRPSEIGRQAVEQLLRRIADPHAPVRTEILVEPRLVKTPHG